MKRRWKRWIPHREVALVHAEIRRLHLEGLSVTEISRRVDRHRTTVAAVLDKPRRTL